VDLGKVNLRVREFASAGLPLSLGLILIGPPSCSFGVFAVVLTRALCGSFTTRAR
jgi:hypothetical protein